MKLNLYTDGGCRGNGKSENIGAYAVVAVNNSNQLISSISKARANTTNNEMELMGIYAALQVIDVLCESYCEKASLYDSFDIHSDSAYSINVIESWMWGWESNGWTKKKGDIKNLELIKKIHKILNFNPNAKKINYIKVKGHSGIEYNELADKLLNDAMDGASAFK